MDINFILINKKKSKILIQKKIFNFTLIQKRKIELFLNKNFTNFSFSKILDFIKKKYNL